MNAEQNREKLLLDIFMLRARLGLNTPPRVALNLGNSMRHGAVKIFYDCYQRPVGYVAWADINKESLLRLVQKGKFPSYIYEWSEGGFRLVVDAAFQRTKLVSAPRQVAIFMRSKRLLLWVRRGRLVVYARNGMGNFYLSARIRIVGDSVKI